PLAVEKPAWLHRAVPMEAEPAPPLKPSSALAAADGAERPADGPFIAAAAAAGRLAHLLLQILPGVPAEQRETVATALAQARGAVLSQQRRARTVAEVLALLAKPGLAELFAEGALAEVPVAGTITLASGETRAVSGQI